MNRIGTYLSNFGRGTRVVILSLAVIFVSAGISQAATTITTSVSTANVTATGTLDVTGQTTLGQATSTRFSAYSAYFGGSATSTFGTDGALTLVAGLTGTTGSFSSTLGVTGLTTMIQASSTRLSVFNTAYFGGTATSTFSSDGSLSLSSTGTLGVTGLASFGNASTTGPVSVAGTFMVNGNATTTPAGAISTQSTLTVAGNTTLSNASTTQSATIGGPLWVGGNATTTAAGALQMNGDLTVGSGLSGQATSTATVGCVVTTATSSATKIRLMYNVEATSTTLNGNTVQGLVLWGYGTSCTN